MMVQMKIKFNVLAIGSNTPDWTECGERGLANTASVCEPLLSSYNYVTKPSVES